MPDFFVADEPVTMDVSERLVAEFVPVAQALELEPWTDDYLETRERYITDRLSQLYPL